MPPGAWSYLGVVQLKSGFEPRRGSQIRLTSFASDPQRDAPVCTFPRTITNARMGQALFGGDDLQRCTASHVPRVHTFRERSQTHAWAKPCLAGRPTALVRTQPPEQNTSRSRPSGMELPDYPVMVLTPTPTDQDGPALPLPAGSFPRFVARSAPRRVFS
jgi:hypothetical protein